MGHVPPRPRRSEHKVTLVDEQHVRMAGGEWAVYRTYQVASGPYATHAIGRRNRDETLKAVEEEIDELSMWDREFEEQTGIKVEFND